MNLESNSTEVFSRVAQPPADDDSLVDRTSTGIDIAAEIAVAEVEQAAIARAATLLIDTPTNDAEAVNNESIVRPKLRYAQGVIQNRRAFLITNLLQDESQTLHQPQMVWTIGRNRSAALPLDDRALSRRHAVILYAPNIGFQLIDLNSMNGSFVNGTRIQQRHVLEDGDYVRMGSTDFVFFCSQKMQTIEPIHPEVLARFNATKSRSNNFIDYSALEEPEILFNTSKD